MNILLMILALISTSYTVQSSAAVLANNQLGPLFTTNDGVNVYWTNYEGGQVMKAPVDGRTPAVELAKASGPRRLRVDNGKVYWAETSSGKIMSIDAGGGTPVTLASEQSLPMGLVVADGYAYWTNAGGGNFDGSVMRLALGGGKPEVLASNQAVPMGLEVVNGTVYWSTVQEGTVGKIYSLSLRERKTVELATAYAGSLSSDNARLYWPDYDGQKVMAMNFADGKITVIASGQEDLGSLTSDGKHVYWTTTKNGYGSLSRAEVAGGQIPEVLIRDSGLLLGLSTDDKNIYWADRRAFQILSMPKN